MARLTSQVKHIACLESLYDNNLHNRLSVLPLLEFGERLDRRVRFSHFTVNTREELTFNLHLFRRRKPGILYLASHGDKGCVSLANADITLDELADMMGSGFAGWVVHFSSCRTVACSKESLAAFVHTTGVPLVMGYAKTVDWLESAVMDVLLFNLLQQYKDTHALWKKVCESYPDLKERTGLTAFPVN